MSTTHNIIIVKMIYGLILRYHFLSVGYRSIFSNFDICVLLPMVIQAVYVFIIFNLTLHFPQYSYLHNNLYHNQ